MTYVLGIHGFSALNDNILHDTGVTLVKDGLIIAAINEERLTRKKNDGSFPWLSYEKVMEMADITPDDIDIVAFADETPEWQMHKIFEFATKTLKETGVYLQNYLIESIVRTKDIDRSPPVELKKKSIHFVEHHIAHAASAYYCSPWDKATIVTLDGMGDYCVGGTICSTENGQLNVLKRTNGFYSPGIFYMIVTDYLGFKPGRHEGKITGLAAYGNPNICYGKMEKMIEYRKGVYDFYSKPIPEAIEEWRVKDNSKFNLHYFKDAWKDCLPKDIAAAAQKRLEDIVIAYIQDAIKLTGEGKIAVAGGVFANVRLNQKILELPDVENLYVYPNMNDAGLSTGAALYTYYKFVTRTKHIAKFQSNLYCGPRYSKDEIRKSLEFNRLQYECKKNIEKEIALALNSGKIVGHYYGNMEYGPRALGNRSIIASPTDKNINSYLNKKLQRTEFMPFAPSILEDYAQEYLLRWSPEQVSSIFMTITYEVTEKFKKSAPAAVHIDNTARPQIVKKIYNPRFYQIIKEFYDLSDIPVIINTSFNMHEEPIICSPDDAIKAFKESKIDILVLEDFWVSDYP